MHEQAEVDLKGELLAILEALIRHQRQLDVGLNEGSWWIRDLALWAGVLEYLLHTSQHMVNPSDSIGGQVLRLDAAEFDGALKRV